MHNRRWLILQGCLLLSTQTPSIDSLLLQPSLPSPTLQPRSSRLYQASSSAGGKAEESQSPSSDQLLLQSQSSGTRGNERVREIIEILQSRTGSQSSNQTDWNKTRQYLYHRTRTDLSAAQVNKVIHFLEDVLQEDRGLIASVVQSNPRILRFSVERYLQPTALFLETLYGKDLFLEAVRRNPGLLLSRGVGCDAPEDLIASIENFFTESLGMKQADLKQLKDKSPWLFQRPLEFVQSIVSFWEDILQHSGKSEIANQRTIGKLLKTYPTLFNLSVDKGLAPKVEYLEEECGLSKKDVASLLTGHRAAVFCLSVQDNLRESVTLLKERLLVGANEKETLRRLRKCICQHPNILCLSRENMMEKLAYFDSIDSMCASKPNTPLASRVAIRSPTVYSLSLQDNIIPKVAFLAGVWGAEAPRINKDEPAMSGKEECAKQQPQTCLATLLAESPSILTMSLEANIQPTLNFYNRTGFMCLDENWKLCKRKRDDSALGTINDAAVSLVRARYIASSLFQRLLPRWHYYLMNKDRSLYDKMRTPPLHILAAASDEAYCAFLSVNEEDFKAFKDEAVPRLKFSSQFDTWLKTGRPID